VRDATKLLTVVLTIMMVFTSAGAADNKHYSLSIDGLEMTFSPSFINDVAAFSERIEGLDPARKEDLSLKLLHEFVSPEDMATLEWMESLISVDELRTLLKDSTRQAPDYSLLPCAIALVLTTAIILSVDTCCIATAMVGCLACAAAGAVGVNEAMEPCLDTGGPGDPSCPPDWSCPANCPINSNCTCPAVLFGADGNPVCVPTP
jgi:hypothetical protein